MRVLRTMWMEEHFYQYWYFYYFPPVVWYFIIAGNVILAHGEGVSGLFALVSLAQLIILGLVIPTFILQLTSRIEVLQEEGRTYLKLLRKLERKGVIEGNGMGGFTIL
ncbi:MAG: hypothetical protein JSW70_06895 [Syntrophobacterales bacterium]|nr:MAG: hypothetical protein JSW70_06895 [Syntrophobacterales bacterium]